MAWIFGTHMDQRKQHNMKDSFYMVLPSNACPLTQPNNKANSYRIDWESALQFDGDWKVALTEFSFNYAPITMSTPSEIHYTSLEIVAYSLMSDESGMFRVNNEKNYKDDKLGIYYQDQKLVFESKSMGFTIVFDTIEYANRFGFKNIRNFIASNKTTSDLISFGPNKATVRCLVEFLNNPILTSFDTPPNYDFNKVMKDVWYVFSTDAQNCTINEKPLPYSDTRIKINLLPEGLLEIIDTSQVL